MSGGVTNYVHRLHALDLATGVERINSPVLIAATNYPGTGEPGIAGDTDGAGHVLWNPLRQNCRAALLLANGQVYIAYASPGDHPPYHGWIFAYDATTLAQTGVFNDTPSAGEGGIWESGNGPAADTSGNVFLMTGNSTNYVAGEYGDSFLKLAGTNGLALLDYFMPYNHRALSDADLDVASAGQLLLPDSAGSAAHPPSAVWRQQGGHALPAGPGQPGPVQPRRRHPDRAGAHQRRRRHVEFPGVFQRPAVHQWRSGLCQGLHHFQRNRKRGRRLPERGENFRSRRHSCHHGQRHRRRHCLAD